MPGLAWAHCLETRCDRQLAILIVGFLAHLVGMIGNRRAQLSTGYQFKWWEVGAYWLCWALIAAFSAYLVMKLFAPV